MPLSSPQEVEMSPHSGSGYQEFQKQFWQRSGEDDWISSQETQVVVLALSVHGCVTLDESLKFPIKVSYI